MRYKLYIIKHFKRCRVTIGPGSPTHREMRSRTKKLDTDAESSQFHRSQNLGAAHISVHRGKDTSVAGSSTWQDTARPQEERIWHRSQDAWTPQWAEWRKPAWETLMLNSPQAKCPEEEDPGTGRSMVVAGPVAGCCVSLGW